MSSWRQWKCIIIPFGTQANYEIVLYLRKYLKDKKRRYSIEQVLGPYENFFYIKDESLISYIALKWSPNVEVSCSYNDWHAEWKKEEKEHRKRLWEEKRKTAKELNCAS